MQTLALDVIEECLNNQRKLEEYSLRSSSSSPQSSISKLLPSDKTMNDLGSSLLLLIRDRLITAAENIGKHILMLQHEVPNVEILQEPNVVGWDPTHCHHRDCAYELFSIYMAIERTEGTYECYCPTCFVKLKRESSNNNTEFKGFILCKHTQARVMRVVEAIQTELDNRSTSNTIAVE
jgi:hypothetical protein